MSALTHVSRLSGRIDPLVLSTVAVTPRSLDTDLIRHGDSRHRVK